MAEMANYLKQACSDYFLRPGVSAPTRPTSLLMSLWSAITDSDAGTGTELVGNAYARSVLTFGTISLPSGVIQTNFTVVFPTATADWAAATHFGIHDHLGNLLQSLTTLTSPITVTNGNHAEVSAGAISLTLS